jgi:hypothetical protein
MTPSAFDAFTGLLTARVAAEPDAVGLVLLGSTSGEPPGPDQWSDHDLFVVTAPGAQERWRSGPWWLPEPARWVLWHRETAHGMKAVRDDGHLVEGAIFDLGELGLARVNRARVALDRGGVTARIDEVRRETARRVRAEAPAPSWLGGQFLGALLVGAGRAARGERASGRRLVQGAAAQHLLELVAALGPPPAGGVVDDLDPSRRVEQTWPAVAAVLDRAVALPPAEGARDLLDAAVEALGERAPWPRAAAAAVRRRLMEACKPAAPGGTP